MFRFKFFNIGLQSVAVIFITLATVTSTDLHCSSDPCMYGICLNDTESSYSCYCIDGYTGINCEVNWDDCWSNPCLNGGTCNDAVAAYNCTCNDGFVGVNCEQKFSECMNQPCLNNGTCVDYNGLITCQCLEGYSGDNCEIDAFVCNSTVCKNSGECIEGPGYSFSCRCPQGWTGQFCEEDVDECAASPCYNGGLCINAPATYTCACLFGFTGKNCDKAIVPCRENPCHNDAVCLFEDDQPICYCVPDYHGVFCELRYDDCESKFARCENGGTCLDGINNYTCECPPDFIGEQCTEYVPTSSDIFTVIPLLRTTETYSEGKPINRSLTTDDNFSELTKTSETYETTLDPLGRDISFETTKYPENVTKITTFDEQTAFVEITVDSTTISILDYTSPRNELSSTEGINAGIFPSVTDAVFMDESTTRSLMSTIDDLTSPMLVQIENVTYKPTVTTEIIPKEIEDISIVPVTIRPDDTAVGETVTSNKTTQYIPEITSPKDTTAPDRQHFLNLSTTETATEAYDTTVVDVIEQMPTVATESETTISSQEEFTTVKDFYKTTFGTDIDGTSPPPSDFVYTCTKEQCANTSLCLQNSTQCDCSHPNNCRMAPGIRNAAFSGKSYIRQQFVIGNDGILHILVKLKTKAKSGIIIHALFDDERYVLLYMEVGQLKFQFSCGLQTMLFGEIDSPINNGYDVNIEMRFQYIVQLYTDKCSARLLVNNTVAMSGEQNLMSHDKIPRHARLHLGGIPVAFTQQFPQIAMGFIGCMSFLKVNNVRRHFIHDSVETYQIEECDSFHCLLNPCKNLGACEEIEGNIRCNCVSGYTGERCERSACDENPCHLGATCIASPGTNFLCICPLGTHGLLCEKDTTISQPLFSVFSPGLSSYIAYGLSSSIKDSMEMKMQIIPHTLEQISLLAFMGQTGSRSESTDHFSLTYVRGYVMLTWDLGSGVRRIFTSAPLTGRTHKAHTIRAGRKGRDAWLFIDGIGNVTGRSGGSMTKMDVSPILYIGGHKSRYFEILPHDLPLHTGFSGCIFDIELRTDDNVFPVTMSSPATGRGVGECHRNECSHHSCKNGALCLNHGPTYSCVCMKDWEGPECSIPSSCTSESCRKSIE